MCKFMLSVGLFLASLGCFCSAGQGFELTRVADTQLGQTGESALTWVDHGDPNNGNRGYVRYNDAIPARDAYRRQRLAANIVTLPNRSGYFVRVFYGN